MPLGRTSGQSRWLRSRRRSYTPLPSARSRDVCSETDEDRRSCSTHSSLFVEEARYGDVVLVHKHRFHHPQDQTDANRKAINTALLTRDGAEMLFARSVLLVEGDGDREFFEAIRRRLAVHDPSGAVDRLVAVPTGSKTRFGPWIRLIRSYPEESVEAPLNWLALVDGDASREIRKGFADAKVRIPTELRDALAKLGQANGCADLTDRVTVARDINAMARQYRTNLAVMPGDLEWGTLHCMSDETVRRVGGLIGMGCATSEELIHALGTKHHTRPRSNGSKHPWQRAVLGREIPPTEVSTDTRAVLKRWLIGAMPAADAELVLGEFEAS